MSNADSEELVTTASDGVTVEKSFEPDDFPVPAIAFVILSEREEAVSVRLVDTVPDRVAPEDIGFHPKYGAEFWGVEGDTIVFEREFEPDEQYTTVYGLRGSDADDAEDFMSRPDLASVDPPLPGGDSGQVVRDVIGGDDDAGAASGPDQGPSSGTDLESAIDAVDFEAERNSDAADPEGSDADSTDYDEAPDVSIDLPEPDGETSGAEGDGTAGSADTESSPPFGSDSTAAGNPDSTVTSDPGPEGSANLGSTGPTSTDSSSTATSETAEPAGGEPAGVGAGTTGTAAAGGGGSAEKSPENEVAPGGFVTRLAAEIRHDEVDDEDLEVLREALGVETPGDSVDARIEHLQAQVANLEAYTDALEGFLDEEGDARRIVREIREDFDATLDRLDEVEGTADEAAETARSVDEDLEETLSEYDERLEETFSRYDERLEESLSELGAKADDVDEEVESRLETVDRRIESLDDDIEETVAAELDELWTSIDEAAADAADVDDELDLLREDLKAVETDVQEMVDERLDAVEADLEAVETDLEETVDERVSALDEQVDDLEDDLEETVDERVSALDEQVDDLEDGLEELAEMRDRLATALGGFAGGDDDGDDSA